MATKAHVKTFGGNKPWPLSDPNTLANDIFLWWSFCPSFVSPHFLGSVVKNTQKRANRGHRGSSFGKCR